MNLTLKSLQLLINALINVLGLGFTIIIVHELLNKKVTVWSYGSKGLDALRKQRHPLASIVQIRQPFTELGDQRFVILAFLLFGGHLVAI